LMMERKYKAKSLTTWLTTRLLIYYIWLQGLMFSCTWAALDELFKSVRAIYTWFNKVVMLHDFQHQNYKSTPNSWRMTNKCMPNSITIADSCMDQLAAKLWDFSMRFYAEKTQYLTLH
jgi:hypothetical protein